MPDLSLLMLIDEIRSKTLKLLDGVSPAEALFAPPGLANHCLWHAGHSYVVTEWLTLGALGRTPNLPAGWYELFSWESHPAQTDRAQWPALDTVVGELAAQQHRLKQLAAELSDNQLAAPAHGRPDRSVRQRILHAFHDEANHGGEIWLLRKLYQIAAAK